MTKATSGAMNGTSKPAPVQSVTRDAVLLEAARLFRHRGYTATTLRDIADAAGMKAGSIYYHFSSKEELLGEVLDKGMQVVFDEVRRRVESLPPDVRWQAKLAACMEGHLWGMLHHGDFTTANIRMYGQLPTSAKNRNRAIRKAYAAYWEDIFEGAFRSGELRNDSSTSMLRLYVLGALNWTVEWYNPQRGSFADFSRQIMSFVFDGILSSQPGKAIAPLPNASAGIDEA